VGRRAAGTFPNVAAGTALVNQVIYLLDTNVCIQLLNKKHAIIQQNFRKHSALDIVLCSIVKAELLYGARRSERIDANLALLNAFFAPLQSLHFDDNVQSTMGKSTLIF